MTRRLVALGIAVALAAAGCGSQVTPPPASPTAGPPASQFAPGPVRFMTSDGVELEGRLFGSGSKGVVLAHMRPADMTSWFAFAEVLADAGYRVLAFNFRGYGGSGGDGFRVDVDTRAAVETLAALGASRVDIVGASMGGTGAIAAAAKNPLVAGVVALSAPFTFEGVDAKIAAIDVDVPVLFIVADGDVDANGGRYRDHAIEIGRSHPDTMVLLSMTGSSHGTALFADHGPAVTNRILDLLRQTIG